MQCHASEPLIEWPQHMDPFVPLERRPRRGVRPTRRMLVGRAVLFGSLLVALVLATAGVDYYTDWLWFSALSFLPSGSWSSRSSLAPTRFWLAGWQPASNNPAGWMRRASGPMWRASGRE